jgi:hypothetical protein
MDELAEVRGRGWEKWEDIEVCETLEWVAGVVS